MEQVWVWFLLVGVLVGIVSGMVGIGGGVLVIPILTFAFGFDQKMANGTSLAMLLPPIGIFAFLEYRHAGNVNMTAAILLAAGFAIGGFFGGRFANAPHVPEPLLRRIFAFFLLYVAGMILFRGDRAVRTAIYTTILICAYAATYALFRLVGKRWQREAAIDIYREQRQKADWHSSGPDYEI